MPVKMTASRRYYRRDDRREYRAGEGFVARDDREADSLVRTKKATRAAIDTADGTDDTAALRATYEATVGRRPFMGWNADQLRMKIGEYNRRDMRAEE